jgi:hypothetical protein
MQQTEEAERMHWRSLDVPAAERADYRRPRRVVNVTRPLATREKRDTARGKSRR